MIVARTLIGAAAAGTLATCAQAQTPASAWTVDVGAIARQRPAHLGSPRYTADLLGEEWDSVLLKTRHVATAGLGLVYHFGRREAGG